MFSVSRVFVGLFTAIVLSAFPAFAAPPSTAPNGLVEAEAHNVDDHQVLYGSVYDFGRSFVFTISNGARFDPLHLNAHFQFLDAQGNLLGEIVKYGWCPASLGGHAKRCDTRFQAEGSGLYQAATRIKMFGERTAPHPEADPEVHDWRPGSPD